MEFQQLCSFFKESSGSTDLPLTFRTSRFVNQVDIVLTFWKLILVLKNFQLMLCLHRQSLLAKMFAALRHNYAVLFALATFGNATQIKPSKLYRITRGS
jgi:hypothetical protein